MPLRIPFTTKRPTVTNGLESTTDENARPTSQNGIDIPGAYKDRESLALKSKENGDEPNEFKLSAVNDSGVYLPPSPIEKKSFWHKSPRSSSSHHRSIISENEPFSISRESFESYRRSFDISGRSPVILGESFPSRTSLDSRSLRLPRSAVNGNTFDRPSTTQEESFEDVGLHDEPKTHKKSFLSRFADSSDGQTDSPDNNKTTSMHGRFHLPGRKRGQSGTGSELGNMQGERPASKGKGDAVVR